jgi:FkbH-like protein
VFVDDSLTELAEIAAKYPEITTVPFPAGDANAIAATLNELAGLLWREQVTAEDSIRLSSLRSAAELEQAVTSAEDELAFLRDLDGRITIRAGSGWEQPRVLELVNKTNQFNLNGRRFDEVRWRELCTRPGSIVWTISYEDRFGPLGVISVLGGVRKQRTITVDCWVLSCRAFSRAIEHHVLRSLCDIYNPERIDFDFMVTERNGVLGALLDRIAAVGDTGRLQLDCGVVRDHDLADIHVTHHHAADE